MPMRFLITGGAGFIGSHLADYLLAANHSVSVLDSFVSSGPGNLPSGAPVIKQDVCSQLDPPLFQGFDAVFHLAADPNVKDSALRAKESFVVNVSGTFNVLEACRKADIPKFVFTSSSVVYGEAKTQPTPEGAPTVPVSNYAASKLAGEAYCASFAHTYGMKCTVLRLANIIGERSTHGVMFDFYNKLRKNPHQLEILGDGKQNKSYLHVSDCVSGIATASERQSGVFDIYNVGSEEKRTVDEIARTLCSELNLSPEFKYTGGKKGWAGDVAEMLLDVGKLKSLGWEPGVPFREAVKRYVRWLRLHNQ